MGIYNKFNIRVLLLSYEQVIDYLQIMYKIYYFFLNVTNWRLETQAETTLSQVNSTYLTLVLLVSP